MYANGQEVRVGQSFTLGGVDYELVEETEDYLTLRDRLGTFDVPIRDTEYGS